MNIPSKRKAQFSSDKTQRTRQCRQSDGIIDTTGRHYRDAAAHRLRRERENSEERARRRAADAESHRRRYHERKERARLEKQCQESGCGAFCMDCSTVLTHNDSSANRHDTNHAPVSRPRGRPPAHESNTERDRRRAIDAAAQRHRHAGRGGEEREIRLAQMRQRALYLRERETPEQRDKRRAADAARHRRLYRKRKGQKVEAKDEDYCQCTPEDIAAHNAALAQRNEEIHFINSLGEGHLGVMDCHTPSSTQGPATPDISLLKSQETAPHLYHCFGQRGLKEY